MYISKHFFLNRGAVICEIGAVYSQMASSVEFFFFLDNPGGQLKIYL